ncbi:MAG TPA: hypothetical protein VNM37_21000 [Candidatus Dormibacteraeota bacterium]|nr:hypothetical protein [Candidatus Dormibacteraeota bacterium]
MNNDLFLLLRDRRFWQGSTLWVVGWLVAANLAAGRLSFRLGEERTRNLLTQASPAEATHPNANVRYDLSVGEDLPRYLPYVPDGATRPLVILCGMSQMYAINERQPGDQTISEWMDDALAPKGVRVFGMAAPNLCNEEALFLLVTTLSHPQTKPVAFIYGACFDKFRNVDLRPNLLAFLRSRSDLQRRLADVAVRCRGEYPLASEKILGTLGRLHDSSAVPGDEDRFEHKLREALGRQAPLVGLRKELNAAVQARVYLLRNRLLGITPTTKRPVIPSRYALNRQFLALLVELARDNGVEPIIFVNPLNPVSDNPYVASDYAEFKNWLAQLAREKHFPTANLENAVPAGEWGVFNGGPDFKHFKGTGHRLTAQALVENFGPLLLARKPRLEASR